MIFLFFISIIVIISRDDGDPHKAIILPTSQPFFLLQYGNFCQEVGVCLLFRKLFKSKRFSVILNVAEDQYFF